MLGFVVVVVPVLGFAAARPVPAVPAAVVPPPLGFAAAAPVPAVPGSAASRRSRARRSAERQFRLAHSSRLIHLAERLARLTSFEGSSPAAIQAALNLRP